MWMEECFHDGIVGNFDECWVHTKHILGIILEKWRKNQNLKLLLFVFLKHCIVLTLLTYDYSKCLQNFTLKSFMSFCHQKVVGKISLNLLKTMKTVTKHQNKMAWMMYQPFYQVPFSASTVKIIITVCLSIMAQLTWQFNFLLNFPLNQTFISFVYIQCVKLDEHILTLKPATSFLQAPQSLSLSSMMLQILN